MDFLYVYSIDATPAPTAPEAEVAKIAEAITKLTGTAHRSVSGGLNWPVEDYVTDGGLSAQSELQDELVRLWPLTTALDALVLTQDGSVRYTRSDQGMEVTLSGGRRWLMSLDGLHHQLG